MSTMSMFRRTICLYFAYCAVDTTRGSVRKMQPGAHVRPPMILRDCNALAERICAVNELA